MQAARQHAQASLIVLTIAAVLRTVCAADAGAFLSPVSIVADRTGRTLYVAEATAAQVAVVDIASAQVADHVPVAERPVGLALSPSGESLYVTSAVPAGTVQIVDVASGNVVEGIGVGHTPVAVTAARNGESLYVCNQFDNTVGVIDLSTREQIATITVPREPLAAALTLDGRHLLVANHLPTGPANADYIASSVSVIDTAALEMVESIEFPDGSTNLRGITVSPDGTHAYVTHTLARYRFPVTYLERGWVNTNAMTIIDVPTLRYVNTVLLDDVGRGAANPYGLACTGDGRSIVVTHAGTHELSVVDRVKLHARLLPTRLARDFVSASTSTSSRRFSDPGYTAEDVPNDLTFMTGIRRRIKLPGNGPRALAIVGATAYVAEYFSDSVAAVDLGPDTPTEVKSVALGRQSAPTQVRLGEMLFHDATHAWQNWHSCASCHAGDGRVDALNWDLLNDGMLNPKNGRSLLLAHQTPPAMATGVRADAETAVRSGILYVQFAVPRRRHAEAIDEYLKSRRPVASPHLVDGRLSAAALRGEAVFHRAGCDRCHAGPFYTDGLRHRVGTATENEPRGRFDTPTLIEVWRTAPYLHDGRAVTVRDVLTTFNEEGKHGGVASLTDDEICDLVEYVLTR